MATPGVEPGAAVGFARAPHRDRLVVNGESERGAVRAPGDVRHERPVARPRRRPAQGQHLQPGVRFPHHGRVLCRSSQQPPVRAIHQVEHRLPPAPLPHGLIRRPHDQAAVLRPRHRPALRAGDLNFGRRGRGARARGGPGPQIDNAGPIVVRPGEPVGRREGECRDHRPPGHDAHEVGRRGDVPRLHHARRVGRVHGVPGGVERHAGDPVGVPPVGGSEGAVVRPPQSDGAVRAGGRQEVAGRAGGEVGDLGGVPGEDVPQPAARGVEPHRRAVGRHGPPRHAGVDRARDRFGAHNPSRPRVVPQHPARAAGDHPRPVRGERDSGRVGARRVPQLPPSRPLPDAHHRHRPGLALEHRQPAAARGERDRATDVLLRRPRLESGPLRAGVGVPHAHGAVAPGGGHAAAVRAERDGRRVVRVPAELAHGPAGVRVEQADDAGRECGRYARFEERVPARRRHAGAVRRDGEPGAGAGAGPQVAAEAVAEDVPLPPAPRRRARLQRGERRRRGARPGRGTRR